MALLVKPDIPPVTQLLRGMFNAHFLMMRIAAIIGTVTFALTGRPISAVVVALVAAFVMWARGWFLQKWDTELSARDAGDATAEPVALGRHALQRDPADRGHRQHSLRQHDGDVKNCSPHERSHMRERRPAYRSAHAGYVLISVLSPCASC